MSAAEIAAGPAFGHDRRLSPRAALLVLIVAAHVAAILALIAPAPHLDVLPPADTMSVFDVIVPPPPPPPLPPPSPPAVPERAAVHRNAGGSPGRRQERATAAVMADRDAAPPRMEATITAEALPLPPSGHVVDAVGIDLGSGAGTDVGHGGADGRGTGSGRGTGAGEGDGVARYQRAKWLSRPTDSAFDRVWPTREVNGKNVRQIGWAYLACRVESNGQPYDCRTLYEKPASIGMGAAAISVAAQSRVRPVFRNGVALPDLRVLIPIVFGHERISVPRVNAEASVPRAR